MSLGDHFILLGWVTFGWLIGIITWHLWLETKD